MRQLLAIPSGFVLALGMLAMSNTAMAHDGLYARLGAGLGFYNVSFETSDDHSLEGLTVPADLLIGGSIMPGLVVGGGLTFDYAPSPSGTVQGIDIEPDFSQFLFTVGPFVDWYFNPEGGLHAQARIGWGFLETSSDEGGGSTPSGPAFTLGGGYDHWVSDTLGVGGLVRFTFAPLSADDISYTTLALNVLASITYY